MSSAGTEKQRQNKTDNMSRKPREIAAIPGVLIAAGGLVLAGDIGILGAAVLISSWLVVPAVYVVAVGGVTAGALGVSGTPAIAVIAGLASIVGGLAVTASGARIRRLVMVLLIGAVLGGLIYLVSWLQSLLWSGVVLVIGIGVIGYVLHRLSLVLVVFPRETDMQQTGDST